jgi:hypothetical protein
MKSPSTSPVASHWLLQAVSILSRLLANQMACPSTPRRYQMPPVPLDRSDGVTLPARIVRPPAWPERDHWTVVAPQNLSQLLHPTSLPLHLHSDPPIRLAMFLQRPALAAARRVAAVRPAVLARPAAVRSFTSSRIRGTLCQPSASSSSQLHPPELPVSSPVN